MTHRIFFPRDATDEEVAAIVISHLAGVTYEEAARILAEEPNLTVTELATRKPSPPVQEGERRSSPENR